MSELTKIASILFKNLSDALLLSASEVSRLDSAPPLSQADEKPELVSLEPRTFTKRENYKVGDRIMVSLGNGLPPVKMKVSHVKGAVYLAYFLGQLKSSGREIRHEQILGLDPDR
ncbi:MAG: hypothetical protein ACK5ZI_11000 [bacterium]|jgi:hypothetical protein